MADLQKRKRSMDNVGDQSKQKLFYGGQWIVCKFVGRINLFKKVLHLKKPFGFYYRVQIITLWLGPREDFLYERSSPSLLSAHMIKDCATGKAFASR
jgi:hypothetical protein